MLQCSGKERGAGVMYSVSSCTATLKTSVLQHSISDTPQFDDELEWNLLHTDSYFSMQFLFHS